MSKDCTPKVTAPAAENELTEDNTQTETQTTRGSFLTGAVIGDFVQSTEGIATLGGLLAIIIAGIIIFSIRKKKKKENK